jgi:NAD(P)-dependent dehydrogenase (short-subunit alcohol dehydrogenase family)
MTFLNGKTVLVIGGEGLLGKMMVKLTRELLGVAWSFDVAKTADVFCDITDRALLDKLAQRFAVDIIINAAVGNQFPVGSPMDGWDRDIAIGLTGMANVLTAFEPNILRSNGVVLNIGSDLGLIAPDPRLYPEGTCKPASYSAVKHGVIGLTRYYASRWGNRARINCLCPGGIDQGQVIPDVPMKRLAKLEEMKGPVAFMITEASSYMTGAVVSVDGGRTIW